MKKQKFIRRWVTLNFNGVIKKAKITAINFNQELGKPVFTLVSQLGNKFYLTRQELKDHEVEK